MFAAYETTIFSKSRVMKDTAWDSLEDAIAYFQDKGAYVSRDEDGFEAADVMTKGGLVFQIEAI